MSKKQRRIQIEICNRLAMGESLRAICAGPDMPDKSTVFAWLAVDPEFQRAYAVARAFQAETYADEIIEIADDATGDWVDRENRDGELERAFDREHVERAKLRVDARKWMAAKLAPKKFGDSTALRLAGSDRNRVGGETMEITLRLLTIAATAAERKIK